MNGLVRACLVALLLTGAGVRAVPPCLYYQMWSVQNYVANGCGYELNMSYSHAIAVSWKTAVTAYARNYPYDYDIQSKGHYQDNYCLADEGWTRLQHPWVNGSDFAYVCARGDNVAGARLGCTYPWQFVMPQQARLHADGWLKWLQLESPDVFWQVDPLTYWTPSFQGVHAVMGHRAWNGYQILAYDNRENWALSKYTAQNEDFWHRWKDLGQGLKVAWILSQRYMVFDNGTSGVTGLQPAIMCPIGFCAPGVAWYDETWTIASDVAAPNGAAMMVYITLGTPRF
jgi:hypothetical protein